jgi:hypothetical protein
MGVYAAGLHGKGPATRVGGSPARTPQPWWQQQQHTGLGTAPVAQGPGCALQRTQLSAGGTLPGPPLQAGGKEDELPSVGYKKYRAVSPTAFAGTGKKTVAIIRASGALARVLSMACLPAQGSMWY